MRSQNGATQRIPKWANPHKPTMPIHRRPTDEQQATGNRQSPAVSREPPAAPESWSSQSTTHAQLSGAERSADCAAGRRASSNRGCAVSESGTAPSASIQTTSCRACRRRCYPRFLSVPSALKATLPTGALHKRLPARRASLHRADAPSTWRRAQHQLYTFRRPTLSPFSTAPTST